MRTDKKTISESVMYEVSFWKEKQWTIFLSSDMWRHINVIQRAKVSTRSITHLCWCNSRTCWRQNAAGRSPRGSCSCTTMLLLTGHLQPTRNWPVCVSNVLIIHPVSPDVCPVGLPPVPWTENKKTSEMSPFFFRRGGHCCHGDLVERKKFWIFLSGM